ncbi:MAG: DNA translocase FtsK [Oscillospiraceae bacterium]
MAQSKSASSGGGAKKPTSTARKPGTAASKKTTSSASRSTAKKTDSRSTAKNTASRSAAKNTGSRNETRTKPIRREVGAMVLLFLGIVAVIALFPSEGWLVDGWRALIGGLFGWGYYLAAVAILWGAYILGFHRGRPVRLRLACVLLLPLVFGAFVHALWNDYDGARISWLWRAGCALSEHCGGVLAGLIGFVLRKALSRVGAFIVLVAAFLLMMIEGLNLSLPAIAELVKTWLQERPKLFYEPEDASADEVEFIDEADRLNPEDYLFPLDGSSPIRRMKERGTKKQAAPARTSAEETVVRRRMYDEAWEERKDRLFAAMEIDDGAKMRVAAALREEQRASRERRTAEAVAKRNTKKDKPSAEAKKPAETGVIVPFAAAAKEKTPAAAELTKDVEPIALEEAAQIAGVELNSADMDAGAAVPAAEKKEKIDKDAEAALVAQAIADADAADKPEYIFPDLSLLNRSKPGSGADMPDVDDSEARLEAAIRSYGVGATITGVVRGPSITRYELKLDQGVKLNKITNLAGDIALSLGVSGVRIAPIPDKISTVGVEVPNRVKQTVWLGDVIDSDEFRHAKSKLSVSMGKDISGNVIIGNIAKMPHVLIAGTTGSGKSVCINSIILSLLYKSTPDEVRMIMIDPKMVELGIYNGMPHLYVPVVTDPKKAAGALQWSVVEMLKRYRLFSEVGVRDLAGYNAVLTQNDQPILPQVVIIIDELADLMMVASKEVEESICRVAQMGRAAGMHLVVATQRPSADVITGLMKANIPSRIAFAVASSLESRIILDQQGAEALVGSGDMLYSPIGKKPIRVQGAFVTDEEREEIINFVKHQAEAVYSDEILAEIEKASADKNDKGGSEKEDAAPQSDYDELLPQAVEVIFETNQASVSMLQRRLKLGYSRAARLIDQLEEVGVVGPYVGSKPREIMITKQQWQEMQYAQGTAPVDTIVGESLAAQFNEVADNEAFSQPAEEEDEPAEELAETADDVPWEEDEP